MFLIVLFMTSMLHGMQEPTSSIVVIYNTAAARSSSSEDEVCDMALATFMRRTDSDLAKYIKPHLACVIKEANSSPDSDESSDDPSPHRVIKTWVTHPDSIKSTPKQELDDVILKAVHKAFEEKDAEIEKRSKKIDGMFSKRDTTLITVVISALVTIVSSITSVFVTKDHC
jgi:hypothetical protein